VKGHRTGLEPAAATTRQRLGLRDTNEPEHVDVIRLGVGFGTPWHGQLDVIEGDDVMGHG
jgi:hypothetical protein